jgi:hypothetical protein
MLLDQSYKLHQLVHILCNAIFCGLQNVTGFREAVQLKVGSKFQCDVLTLREDGYVWQTAAIDITAGACSRMVIPFLPSLMCLNWQGGVGTMSRALRAQQ